MQKVLSVSVAAYNVQEFIRQCLDSFLDEAILDRVEVLVTDDGSKDRTAEIVAGYEKQYPGTFRLISQKNAGPGSTVNSGLAHATGKYFRMVDGDDWVNTREMGKFLDALEKTEADMVCTNYCQVDHETGQIQPVTLNREPCSMAPFEVLCPGLSLSMHNVTYRTALLKGNHIHLDNGFYTDAEYLLFPIPFVKTAGILDLDIYQYRVSLSTQSMNIKSLQKNMEMHRTVLNHLVEAFANFAPNAQPNTARFMARSIAGMAGMQLYIYLSLADVKGYQTVTRQMMAEIRQKSPALYRQVNQAPTFRLLAWSRFALFPWFAARQQKKLGLKA